MLSNGEHQIESVNNETGLPNGASMAPHATDVVTKINKKSNKNLDKVYDIPKFYQELESQLTIDEGEPLRLLSKVGPSDDPSLTVQWYKDDKPLNTGSRFSTIYDRGFIVLDIHYTIEDDAGHYICRAASNSGSVDSNISVVQIIPESGMISQSQLPEDMMQSIQNIELRNSHYSSEQQDTQSRFTAPPQFIQDSSLTLQAQQGLPMHIEAYIAPIADSSLVIDWIKDGKPIALGSRINTIYDRGYCSLDIAYCYPEDSGEYVCIAKNSIGQSQSLPKSLVCQAEESIVTKSNLTESSIQNLKLFENPGDEYSMSFQRQDEPVSPKFLSELEPQQTTVVEGQPVAYQVKIDPGNGEKLSYDWYHNDQVIDTCSRLTGKLEMMVASLKIQYTLATDTGSYKCVVFTEHGRAETQPVNLTIETEHSIVSAPQSKGIGAIQALEAELNAPKFQQEQDDTIRDLPSFTKPLNQVDAMKEGDSLLLATKVEPVQDNSLYVDWYKNGELLMNGARFRINYERGVASLNISSLIAEDSGEYWLVAINKNGQTESNKIQLNVSGGESIVTTSSLLEDSEGFKRLKEMEQDLANNNTFEFRNVEETETECPPNFDVKPMNITVGENCPAKFLVKIGGFPRPTIEWFIDEVAVSPDSLCKTYNDGSINYLEINRCSELGESNIHVKATNALGVAEADAVLTVVQTVNFKPDLKHITPENPYKKMAGLKKVQCSDELASAMKKSRPTAEALTNMEKGKFNRPQDVVETERLYDQVASSLRRSHGSRAGSESRSPVVPPQPSNNKHVEPSEQISMESNE